MYQSDWYMVYFYFLYYTNIVSIRRTPLVDGEFYHIYSRGNSKQKIFLDSKDYQHFVNCLFVCNTYKKFKFSRDIKLDPFIFEREESIVSIGAWVLMPNHFHIYITTSKKSDFWKEVEKSRISEFMRKLLTAYTLYFNKKYNRTGGLFEGKFKSVHIDNENQAKYLFSYIHLNPIKLIQKDWKEKGIKDIKKSLEFLQTYRWSSYGDYNGIAREENKIIDRENFFDYFSNSKDFKKEVFNWINFKV